MKRHFSNSLRTFALVFAALSVTACTPAPDGTITKPIDTQSLALLTVTPSVTNPLRAWDGVIEARQSATLRAQTAGQITAFAVDVGDRVQARAVLVQINDVEPRAAQKRAQAALQAAQARATQTDGDFKRMQSLLREHVVSNAQLEQSLAQRDTAQANLAAQREALAQATQNLSYSSVRAPFAGVISARAADVGEIVAPGTELITLNAPSLLRVSLNLPSSVADSLAGLTELHVQANNDYTLRVNNIVIFPSSDALSHTVTVRADLVADSAALKPGMTVKVLLPQPQADAPSAEIFVPESAVIQRGEVSGVYVVSKQTIFLRQVRLGRNRDGADLKTPNRDVQILSGLDAGEAIAADPLAASLRLTDAQ